MRYMYWLILLIIASCNEIIVKEALPDNYVLLEDKQLQIFSISYDLEDGFYVECISPRITKYVYNQDFILVGQKKVSDSEFFSLLYYIIPLKDKVSNSVDLNSRSLKRK